MVPQQDDKQHSHPFLDVLDILWPLVAKHVSSNRNHQHLWKTRIYNYILTGLYSFQRIFYESTFENKFFETNECQELDNHIITAQTKLTDSEYQERCDAQYWSISHTKCQQSTNCCGICHKWAYASKNGQVHLKAVILNWRFSAEKMIFRSTRLSKIIFLWD